MIQTPIDDSELDAHLKHVADDGIDIFLLQDGAFRGAMLHGTAMLNQMRANHELGIAESLVLGHAYLAAGLMTSMVKGRDRVALDLNADGPARGVAVEADAGGQIRGYLKTDAMDVTWEPQSFDTAQFIGTSGSLSVSRILEGAREAVTGHIEIEEGGIARDLARYFTISEQTPTAINLSVQFDEAGRIVGAGGLFLQALPTAYPEERTELDALVQHLDSIGASFRDGQTGASIINRDLADFHPEMIGTRPVAFVCRCSKERFGRYLASLPNDEITDIREHGPFPLVTSCYNCNSHYEFTREELEKLWTERQPER